MDLNEDTHFEGLDNRSDEVTIRRSLDVRELSWYDLVSLGNFDVPDYQRNYSWESTETGDGNERDEFWRTLRDTFDALDPVPSYIVDSEESPPQDGAAGLYMGAVYISKSGDSQYDVVDGQQRLVSFQLLIGALLENIDTVRAKIEEEEDVVEYLELNQSIEKCQEDLSDAYDDGFASLSLNEEDEDFFKMLAAQPTQTSMSMEVIDYLLERVEEDDNLDGQNKPRAIEAKNLINYLNGDPTDSHGDLRTSSPQSDNLHGLQENKLSVDTIEARIQNELDGADDEEESDVLSTYIRFFESHAKLLNCYLEAHGFVEDVRQEYGGSQLKKEANSLINLANLVLYGITVGVIEITSNSTDVGLEIFESINDRGKELENVDKIRARIKYVLDENADSGVMDSWRETLDRFGGDKGEIEDMLKYYVGATDKKVDTVSEADNALMEVFSDHSENYTARLGSRDEAKKLVQDVYEFSEYYYHICDNNMNDESQLYLENRSDLTNKKIAQMDWIIKRLNDIDFTQWFVLGPRMCQEIDNADDDDIADDSKGEFLQRVFDAIEVTAMRQSISEKSGEATEGIFTNAVQNLSNSEEDSSTSKYDSSVTVSEMADELINKTPTLFGSGLISNITKEKAWHSYANSTVSKALLTRIVNADLGEDKYGAEMWDEDDDLTIEHVLPDTPISDNIKSERSGEIGPHEWLRIFFKFDEVDSDDDNDTHRIVSDISTYIVDGGVMTTNRSEYRQAAQFLSQLQDGGISDLSTDTLEDASDAIESADDDEVDNEVVKSALEFESVDDIDDVSENIGDVLSTLDLDKYDIDNNIEETGRLIDEINERFIDDIANLFFLSFADNPVASNNLLSKKLTVLSDDDYKDLIVNEFFQPGGGITDLDDDFSEEDLEAFCDEEVGITDDIANRADHAWNYEAAFERKADLIETIVKHLRYDIESDDQRYGKNEFEFSSEDLEDKIETEVIRDKERRLQRDNF